MKIELINTGDELLLGQVLNTHIKYLSDKMFGLGLRIARQVTVGDGPEIRTVMEEALSRADIVLITGGLGPTTDDVTRDVVAEYFDAPLELHRDLLEKIEGMFRRRHRPIQEAVRVQAMVPRGARVLPNDHGTAPGLYFQRNGKHVFCLPGPPNELYPMFEESVQPELEKLTSGHDAWMRRILRVSGMGESSVQEAIRGPLERFSDLEIGYCARPNEVDVRLISKDSRHLEEAVEEVRRLLGDAVYGEGGESLEALVIHAACRQGKRVVTAESCTGGLVADRLTNVPGASAVLERGWVTYSNASKSAELDVPPEMIEKYGAVSREVAEAMACGALEKAGVDLAVSLTGIAGPDGGTPEKPVGLVFLGLARKDSDGTVSKTVEKKAFGSDRKRFKSLASQAALDMLRRALLM